MSLYAEYFTLPSRVSALGEIDFGASPTATGTVSRLATRYSEEGFWEGGPEDHFAARYTGQLHVKSGGTYTFFLTSDDGSALYINGERVINNDFMHGDIELQVALELGAGMHDIEIRYFDGGWDASLQLEWAGPDSDGQRQIIEGDAFVQKASEEDIDSGTAEDGTGPGDPGSEGTGDSTDSDNDSSQMSGLMARYFTVSGRISSLSDIDFDTTPTETGNVERLAMLRERGGFWEGGPRNKFAAHYAGSLNVESGGTYTFYLTSDDGSALYINGEPVIDNDGLHATREQRVTLELAAGAHDIEIFYFEYRGRASLQLEWAGPDSDGQRQVIEGEAFSHNGLDDDTTDTGDSGSDDTGGDTDTGDSGSDDTGGDTDTGDNGSDGTAGSLSDPSIGVGLTGVVDWSAENPFIDVFKSARDWIGHESGQWGGTSYQELLDAGALDENGWPTEIPSGVDRIGTHILTAQNAGATSLAGRYRLTYDGEGELSINGVNNIEYGDGEIWFEYIPGQSETVGIDILRTGSNGNHIRNISVVHEDNISAFEAGEIFNPNFVELIEDMRSLRFMDWMGTNNSTQSEWADRPQTDSFTWSEGAGGVPVEVMVELANLTGTDPWFNIPHLAAQEYIENFATYVRDNLDPNLKAHFEYSNEVWNWMFEQTQWAGQMGEELWPGQPDAWLQYYALKSVEMAEILDRVYGAEADDRLVKIIATQTGWPGLEEPILNAAQWLASDPDQDRAPHTYFDAYAVTGYFGGSLGSDKAATVRGWVVESIERATTDANALGLRGSERAAYIEEHRYDHAMGLVVQELRDGSITGDPYGSLSELFGEFAYHAQIAEANGMTMVMYEGGTHVVGIGEWVNDQTLSDFFQHLNYSDEMGTLYMELLEGWRDAGGTMFNAFVAVSRPTEWGSWGALRHLDDETSRWDALVEFNEQNPAWWEVRAEGTFADTSPSNVGILGSEESADLGQLTANDDAAVTRVEQAVLIDILANDDSSADAPIEFIEVGAPSNGTVELQDDDTVLYTPDAEFSGTDSFDYWISDDEGTVSQATVVVEVEAWDL